ncbi:CLUMA_CG013538, isoform A [Clunio marinus]|uniref:CLUMA_CG013538, isoform A n=1 Tax=Clunio marinus TaxID=568069 RepID=A0A1J1IP48_9DIPT|nr:CLUMA_CG013538, isoform A [Clunio marinus]
MDFSLNCILIAAIACILTISSVECGGGGGGHHKHYIKAEVPYHVHHEHHVEKVAEVKYIKVPVEKEVKILEPYKVPYKVKVPYIIKQDIKTVPVFSHPIHSSEHVHHASKSYGHEGYSSHAASNIEPIIASHSQSEQVHDDGSSLSKGFESSSLKDSSPSFSHDFTSQLHTHVPSYGFGSEEGKYQSYKVNEPAAFEHDEHAFSGRSFNTESAVYPYPFEHSGKINTDSLFGFGPSDHSGYDFTKF